MLKSLAMFLWHLSPAKLYIMLRYALPNSIKEVVTLKLHQFGLSKYPDAVAVGYNDDPLSMGTIRLGTIVRYPDGAFYKVIEFNLGNHIRFKHVDDLGETTDA